MTTQEEINHIIKTRFGNYEGRVWKQMKLKEMHHFIRRFNGDEKFLQFLKESEELHPWPVYGQPYPPPKSIINQPINNMEQKSHKQQLADLQQKYRRRTRTDLIIITIAFIGLIGGILFTCYVHKEIKKFDQKLKTMQHEPVQKTKGK